MPPRDNTPLSPQLLDFAESIYEDRCFSGVSCCKTSLCEIEFFQCRFESCLFSQSVFDRCQFEQCVFCKCDLSVVKPRESRFTDVRFERSKLIGIDWTLAMRPLTLAFRGCNVSQSTFQKLSLPKLELAECIARESDFTAANLKNADFSNTDFLGSRFVETDLREADFTNAMNYLIDPTLNRLKKAKFSLPEALSLLSAFDIVLK